ASPPPHPCTAPGSTRPATGPAVGLRRPARPTSMYPGPGRPRTGEGRTPPNRPTPARIQPIAPNRPRPNTPPRLGATSRGAGRPGVTTPKESAHTMADGPTRRPASPEPTGPRDRAAEHPAVEAGFDLTDTDQELATGPQLDGDQGGRFQGPQLAAG